VFLQPTAENGLTKDSGADAFQVKSVSKERLQRRLGKITDDQTELIAAAIALCVGC
jgi:mRNA interferase MazF